MQRALRTSTSDHFCSGTESHRNLVKSLRSIALYSLAVSLECFIGLSLAQAPTRAETPPAPLRVVLFERTALSPLSQGFRIELFDNGNVVFDGSENVAQTGRHRLTVAPSVVRNLRARLWNIEPGKMSTGFIPDPMPSGECPPDGECRQKSTPASWKVAWTVELHGLGARKIYERDSPEGDYDTTFTAIIERAIPIRQFRCPYSTREDIPMRPRGLIPKGTELCERHERLNAGLLEKINANK